MATNCAPPMPRRTPLEGTGSAQTNTSTTASRGHLTLYSTPLYGVLTYCHTTLCLVRIHKPWSSVKNRITGFWEQKPVWSV